MAHLTFIHNLEHFKASYILNYRLLYIFWEMLAHLLFIHNNCFKTQTWEVFETRAMNELKRLIQFTKYLTCMH